VSLTGIQPRRKKARGAVWPTSSSKRSRNSARRIFQSQQHHLSRHLLIAVRYSNRPDTCTRKDHGDIQGRNGLQGVQTQAIGISDQFFGCLCSRRIRTATRRLRQTQQDGCIVSGAGTVFHGRVKTFALNSAEIASCQTPAQELLLIRVNQIPKSLNIQRPNMRCRILHDLRRGGSVFRYSNQQQKGKQCQNHHNDGDSHSCRKCSNSRFQVSIS